MQRFSRGVLILVVLLLLQPESAAQAQEGLRFGALFGAGVSGAPLGSIAERHGLYAVPGFEHESRVLLGRRNAEWSLGGIWDRHELQQENNATPSSSFTYRSSGVVLGYSTVQATRGIPVRYGIDLGWKRFEVTSSTPNYYTGEPEDSRTEGHAALLNVSYGVEFAMKEFGVVPQLRLSTNYPNFSGGDGYSALRQSSDLGFKASVGVGLKMLAPLP